MQKGYLAAAALLVLGLAGVGTLALQASRRLGEQGKTEGARAPSDTSGDPGMAERAERADRARGAPRLALGPEPRRPGPGGSERPAPRDGAARPEPDKGAPDAGAARPDPLKRAPDAGAAAARPGADAAAPREGPREGEERPREAGESPREAAEGPPRPEGPEPALVLELEVGSAKPSAADYRRVRDLVDKVGYKDKKYQLTAYAGELPKARGNRALGRQRCQQVMKLFRRRGVSRRWLVCQDPVYRVKDGAPSEAHRGTAWRRVEVRVSP